MTETTLSKQLMHRTCLAVMVAFLGLAVSFEAWARRDRETLVVLETVNGAVLSEALICLEAGEDLYLPMIEVAQALGVLIFEKRADVLSVQMGEVGTDLEFIECDLEDVAVCGPVIMRAGRHYIRLSAINARLSWPLRYDPRRLALTLESEAISPRRASAKTSERSLARKMNPSQGTNGFSGDEDEATSSGAPSQVQRDLFSRGQTSLQIDSDTQSRSSTLSMATAAAAFGQDLWAQYRWEGVGASGSGAVSEGDLTLGRRSPRADLLGPFQARQYELFRTQSPDLGYLSRSQSIWGVQISSWDAVGGSSAFGSRTLRGRGLPQWKVELFINGIYWNETFIQSDYFYEFIDVPVYFGLNSYTFVMTGPLGQKEIREEVYRIDAQSLRPNQSAYRIISGSRDGFGNHFVQFSRGLSESFSLQLAWTQLENSNLRFRRGYWMPQLNYVGNKHTLQLTYLRGDEGGEAIVFSPQLQWGAQLLGAEVALFDRFQSLLVNPSGNDEQRSESRIFTLTTMKWGEAENPMSLQTSLIHRSYRFGNEENLVAVRALTRVAGETVVLERRENLQTQVFENKVELLRTQISSQRQITLQQVGGGDSQVSLAYEKQLGARGRVGLGVDRKIANDAQASWNIRWARDWKQIASEFRVTGGSEIFYGLSLSSLLLRDPRENRWRPESNGDIRSSGIRFLVFVDENENGRFDLNETKIPRVRVRFVQSQREYPSDDQGLIGVSGLAPYTDLVFEVVMESIPNIYLAPAQKRFQRMLTPAQTLEIEVPLVSRFELKGRVNLPVWQKLIPVVIRRSSGEIIARGTTNRQGEFRFQEIPAGSYRLEVAQEFMDSHSLPPLSRMFDLSGIGGFRVLETLEFSSPSFD